MQHQHMYKSIKFTVINYIVSSSCSLSESASESVSNLSIDVVNLVGSIASSCSVFMLFSSSYGASSSASLPLSSSSSGLSPSSS